MRCMVRNLRPVWYCLYYGKRDVTDAAGYLTGEKIDYYSDPVKLYANVSPAAGFTGIQVFGNLADYDKVIVTDRVSCPITETSVLFVDKEPEFQGDVLLDGDSATLQDHADQPLIGGVPGVPLYDYRVRRVSRSLNSVSIAISKVSVS